MMKILRFLQGGDDEISCGCGGGDPSDMEMPAASSSEEVKKEEDSESHEGDDYAQGEENKSE